MRAQHTLVGSRFTVYYCVDSIDNVGVPEPHCQSYFRPLTFLRPKILPTIEKLGGKVSLPKMAQGDGGWFANVTDPEGNRFGIYEARTA